MRHEVNSITASVKSQSVTVAAPAPGLWPPRLDDLRPEFLPSAPEPGWICTWNLDGDCTLKKDVAASGGRDAARVAYVCRQQALLANSRASNGASARAALIAEAITLPGAYTHPRSLHACATRAIAITYAASRIYSLRFLAMSLTAMNAAVISTSSLPSTSSFSQK